MGEQHTRARAAIGAALPSLSLRHKLLLFSAALVLVPGVLLVLIAERSARDSLQEVIGRQLAREAGHTAERIAAVLRTEQETLASFARQDLMREIRVADIDKRISLALKTLRDGSPARLDYLVVEAGGEIVAASDPALIGPLPGWADPEWRRPGPDELELEEAPLRGPRLVMTGAIADPDDPQRFLGTLVGRFDWSLLASVTDGVRRELAAQGIAADVLVVRRDGSRIGGTRSADDPPVTPALLASTATDTGLRPPPEFRVDAGLIVGRASLASDLPDWRLLVVEPRSHALAPARRLSGRLRLTMGLGVLAALAVAALAARRVVRPLSELTRAIRGLSRGAAGPVPVRTDDEVGTLAVAFNEMASELHCAQRELVEAEKFAFVGQLAAGVAHEIRTSLGVLGSSAQILERSLPEEGGEEAGELAGMIREEVVRLGGVVDDLLTLGRARPLELEPAPLSKPLLRAVDFVAPQAREKGIRLEGRSIPREPVVLCEPELVYQVAVSLLVNAIQALGSGGSIQARVLAAEDGYGGFEIRDDGPGIPDPLRESIFQPFVTAREGGMGLGLTFVKRAVHDHRGLVTVESNLGAGTVFRVRLPLAEAAR